MADHRKRLTLERLVPMSASRRRCSAAALLAASLAWPLGSPVAFAQPVPSQKDNAWTNPPARGAERPTAQPSMPGVPEAMAPQRTTSTAQVPPPPPAEAQRKQASRPRIDQGARQRRLADAKARRRVVEARTAQRPPRNRIAARHPPFVREDDPADFRDERSRRIQAAQDAGFLVVRSHSIEFPDGRRLRVYRPYDNEPDE